MNDASHESQQSVSNPRRRALLTLGVTGAGAFLIGKIIGNQSWFGGNTVETTNFSNFTFEESGQEMTLREKGGEVIFIVDKNSFTE